MTARSRCLCMIAALLAAGCTTQQTSTTSTADTTAFRRDSTVTESRFRRLTHEIDSLGARVTTADRRVRDALVGQIEDLRAKRDSTARVLDELRSGGIIAWERTKVGTDSLLGGLERAIENARAALRPDTLVVP